MKKTTATLAALLICAALPAFANDAKTESTTSKKTTYVERTTYRTMKVPLTPEQVAERQRMGTKIEESINRVDTNGDRELNKAEFSYSKHLFFDNVDDVQAFYVEYDKNGDGQLSSQEILKAQLAEREKAAPPIVMESRADEHTVRYKASH